MEVANMKSQQSEVSRRVHWQVRGRALAGLLLWSVASWALVSCKTGSQARAAEDGPLQESTDVSTCSDGVQGEKQYTVETDCAAFTKHQKGCAKRGGQVTFKTDCTTGDVTVYFSNPDDLFTDSASSVTSTSEGVLKTLKAQAKGKHCMCIGDGCLQTACATGQQEPQVGSPQDSSTGSLDVATSRGGHEDEVQAR
jgi:hypothetical protein